jgi:membrane protease YdiL (CAAX protease family)
MNNLLRSIFLTRHSELRIGWRLILFALTVSLGMLLLLLLLRLVGLETERADQLALLISTLAASGGLTGFVNKKPLRAFGLDWRRGSAREFALGSLLGFGLMAGIFVVELMLGYAAVSPRAASLIVGGRVVAAGAIGFGIGALAQELLFRGYAFQTLMQGITFLPAMLVFSAFFAVAHLYNPHVTSFALVNILLAGIWLSFAYLKTRTLWLPLGLHFSWNFSQTVIFSFPTSGGDPTESSLFDLTQSGPVWVTGGDFGPEGGVLATFALLIGTYCILKSPFFRKRDGIVTLDSIEDLLPGGNGGGSTS